MWVLEKETVCQYLKEHYPQFDQSGAVTVRVIGDPAENPNMEETGGFVNYLFRVSNGQRTIVVKQGREEMRMNIGIKLPSDRNRREAESMKLRNVIVPQYTPELYYVDLENAIFLMEDVSRLGSVRYQLCQSVQLEKLGKMVGEFAAANSFYTSEFYLEADDTRRLAGHFRNSELRAIMENWLFLQEHSQPTEHEEEDRLDKRSRALFNYIFQDEEARLRIYQLRHKYMNYAQCSIHGDLHVSNMFANQEELKVIDMEYTFPGPISYDIGYFSSSLVLQYASACFRSFPSEEERASFLSYLLTSLCQVYHSFVDCFTKYWQEDAKEVYKKEPVYLQRFTQDFLPDMLGFAAVPCINQGHYSLLAEFSHMEEEARGRAQTLGTILGKRLLMQYDSYPSIEAAVADMVEVTKEFRAKL